MKNYITVILFLSGTAIISANAQGEAVTGNVNVLLATKALEEDDWGSELDQQPELGVLFDFRQNDWPVNLAVDLLVSADSFTEDGVEVTGSTIELNAGVRKHFENAGSITPYIGGGLALIKAELEAEADTSFGTVTLTEDDNGIGFWLNAGLAWTINQVNFGLDLRYSDAEVTLSGIDGEAGGTHVGLFAGYHW